MPYEPDSSTHKYSYEMVFGSPVNSNVVIPLTIDPSNFGLPEELVDRMVQEIVDLVSKSSNFLILRATKVVGLQSNITPNPEPVVLPPGALDPTPVKPVESESKSTEEQETTE